MFGEAVNAVKIIQPIIMVLVASWPVLCLEMWPGLVQVTMFIAALCIVVKTRKQPKCTQRDEWIKMHDRYIQENNSHKKECSNLEGFGWYYAK